MSAFIIAIHVIVCFALIMIVLLQSGKGAEMGAAFGGSSQTVFGGAGPAPFLSKITTIAAVIFMATSLILAYISAHPFRGSVMEDVRGDRPAATAPAADMIPEADPGAAPEAASAAE
jgi:preprotein translocase subunit SecG